jgi:adenylate kinase family enzyme
MNKSNLIVISGPAATGKTTLGKFLSKELGLPYFYKDQFKEPLYDILGHPDLPMHRKMGAVSHTTLNTICEELLSKSVSHILEGPFSDEIFSPFLRGMKSKYNFTLVQLQLKCQGDVLLERFITREKEGRTHPGHQQGLKYMDAIEETLRRGEFEHLSVEGSKLVIDTTDLSKLNYAEIKSFVQSCLEGAGRCLTK